MKRGIVLTMTALTIAAGIALGAVKIQPTHGNQPVVVPNDPDKIAALLN